MKKIALLLVIGILLLIPAAQAEERLGTISDIVAEGNRVLVDWAGPDAASVRLSVYDDENKNCLQQQTLPVSGGKQTETAVFSVAGLPSNGYVLRAELLDAQGAPLCDPYVQLRYTSEMQELLNQKAQDFAGQKVLELRGFAPGSFLVLKDEVTLVQAAPGLSIAAADGGEGFAVSAADADTQAQLAAVQPGTLVFVDDGVSYSLLKVEKTVQSGQTVTLYGADNDLALDDYCQAAWVETADNADIALQKEIKLLNLPFGSVTAVLELELTARMAVKGSSFSLSILMDYALTDVRLTLNTPSISQEFPIATIPLGLEIPRLAGAEIDVNFVLEGAGAGSLIFQTQGRLGLEAGFSMKKGAYVANRCTAPTARFDGIELEGEIFAGISAGPALQLLKLVTLSANVSGGVVASGSLTTVEYADHDQKWHACEKMKCLQGDFKVKVFCGISLSVLKISRATTNELYVSPPLGEWYHSFTFGDGHMTQCPHWGYRLRVHVKNQNGRALEGAKVTATPNTPRFDQRCQGVTGKDGVVTLYIPLTQTDDPHQLDPTTVALEVEYEDRYAHKLTQKQTFTQTGYKPDTSTLAEPDVTVTMDLTRYIVSFFPNGSGHTGNMPSDFYIYKAEGTRATLPDHVPTKSGRIFRGWAVPEEIQIPRYQPGDVIDVQQNMQLYAVWEVMGSDTYWVIYNANGGENAPPSQLMKKQQDAVIAAQIPTNPGNTFLGWSTDAAARIPQYQPGDRYTGRETITLYAVWEYQPLTVVAVRYDVNGDAKEPAPRTQWVKQDTWVQISDSLLTWDEQHTFLGWSLQQDADKPSYYPGQSYRFTQSVQLYAVWQVQYRMTRGDGGSWVRGGTEPLHFAADGNFAYFTGVEVDGQRIAAQAYAVQEGGTGVDLAPETLKRLSAGTHTLQVCYRDGATQQVTFTVADPPPQTGDNSRPLAWALLALTALAGIALLQRKKAR